MNFKKLLTGIAVSAVAVAGFASASNFADTQTHWAETSGYIDSAIAEGAIDGTKSTFRPDDNISRAELTKMVAVYDNGGEEPTATDYTAPAGFSDVASSAWYYNVINYAADEGIATGYNDNTFRPQNAINRAEAVKVITLAMEVPSVDVTLPFADVPSDAWYYAYVRNAYGNCIVNGRTSTMFEPAAPITRAEAVKVFVRSITPGCETTMPTATAEPTETPDGTATPTATPAVTTDATADVQISAMSPSAQSIPKNAYQVPFLAIDITASDDEDLLLTGLVVQHTGLGDADEVQNVQVFEGVVPRGNDKNFTGENDVATLNLMSDPVVVPAGTTKTVYLKADVFSALETAGEHAMALLDANSVTLVGADTGAVVDTSGTFPIVGATMRVANITVGAVHVTTENVADDSVEAGETDVEIGRFKVETGNAEDVYLQTLTIQTEGVLDDGDIENLYVEVDGNRVSNVVARTTGDYATFELTLNDAAGFLIEDSSTKYLSIRGDLTGPIDNFGAQTGSDSDIAVGIDEASDLTAVGAKYGFGVMKTLNDPDTSDTTLIWSNSVLNYLDISGGDIVFSIESTANDIAEDTQDLILGILTIDNNAEAIEIDSNSYAFWLASNQSTDAVTPTAGANILENVRLVSVANGTTILGPVDVTATNGTVVVPNFTEDLYVAGGQKVSYYIMADTKDNLIQGTTYKVTFAGDASSTDGIANLSITGQVSDETNVFTVKPSGTLSTKLFTVKTPSLTITRKALTSDNYVASQQNAIVWYGTLDAANVKDILIERIGFSFLTSGCTNTCATSIDINGFDFQALIDGEWVTVETGESPAADGTFSFTNLDELTSGDFIIEAGEEVEVRVVADIADDLSTTSDIDLTVSYTGSITAREIETNGTFGDNLTGTTQLVNNATTASATFTLIDAGNLTVSLDSASTPNTALLIAGTTGNEVAVYKFKAEDEDVKVEDLTVTINSDTLLGFAGPEPAADSVSTVKLYDGTTLVASKAVSGGTAEFTDIAWLVPAGTTKLLTVKVDLSSIGTGASDTAQSGHAFTTDLSVVEVKGNDSGDIYSPVTTTPVAGEVYVIMPTTYSQFGVTNNKILAALASSQPTAIASNPELLKVRIFDQSSDADRADLSTIKFNVTGTGGADVSAATFTLSGGNATWGCSGPALTVTCTITSGVEEVSQSGTTFTLKADGIVIATEAASPSVTAKMVVNSTLPGSDGITWIDGGDGTTAGVTVQWVDFGEADESTTQLTNTVN